MIVFDHKGLCFQKQRPFFVRYEPLRMRIF